MSHRPGGEGAEEELLPPGAQLDGVGYDQRRLLLGHGGYLKHSINTAVVKVTDVLGDAELPVTD